MAGGAARGSLAAFPRQALHAASLGFVHPVTGAAMRFEAPLPEDFAGLLAALATDVTNGQRLTNCRSSYNSG